MYKVIALLAIGSVSLRAEMQFSGFFITPSEALFVLSDTDDSVSSGWLAAGQSFRGYSIESFDREHEVITLRKDGKLLELRLREPKVKDGKMTITGLIRLGPNQENEVVRASLFVGEEAAFPLKDGVTLHLTVQRLPNGNILYRPRFSILDKDGRVVSEDFPGIVTLPGGSFSIRNGDLGFSFKP